MTTNSPDLNPIENILESIKHYLGSRIFSNISYKKEIEDKWNQIDHEFFQKTDRFNKEESKYLNHFRRIINRILIFFNKKVL